MQKSHIEIAVKHHSLVKHFTSGQMEELKTFTIYLYVHPLALYKQEFYAVYRLQWFLQGKIVLPHLSIFW